MATLYLVSTPVGNLSDVTGRAREVLGQVSRILAEDTRRSRVLLDHLGLDTPLVSLHEHNEASRAEEVLGWLDAGEDLALISDAGTPLLSDPGHRTVSRVLPRGHPVVPVPGPSAVLAALVASGLPPVPFSFLGFPPRGGEDRRALLDRVAGSEETQVLFESPERLVDLLEDLSGTCGGDREVAVARELTKLHEEIHRGTLEEAARYYRENPARGEVTVVVGPAPEIPGPDEVDEEAARALARVLLERGTRPSQAAREVARRLGIPRNFAYRIVHSLPSGP